MKKSDLIVYKDRINKLNKAAKQFKEAHNNLKTQEDKMMNNSSDMSGDWSKLSNFMKDNPDLTDKLKEVEIILDDLSKY